MCATAFATPFPKNRFESPSRSSRASRSPVDAPDGTAARPDAPPSSVTSTSTVGLPRESRISRPRTPVIFTIDLSSSAAPVGFRLESQRFLARRSNQRLIVGGDDDDPRVGHRVPLAVFLGVVADERAARNQDVAVDDRALDLRVASD